MSIKSHQLQAEFARRRELEHIRHERTAAVNRYYDHWGKVTTRFENWTAPEYYTKAGEQLQKIKDKKLKVEEQAEKRKRLTALFAKEKLEYEEELRALQKPRARKIPATNEQLAKIDQAQKERQNIKRKLDLEAKLYGRWRHGVDDDKLIFESKSDNEVLAKLNWLDKQIENQLEKEKEEAISQERNLRMQQEISKTEQAQKERQQIREQEIKEIRTLQERHMSELKQRQAEGDTLKDEERKVRKCLQELEKELELLEESSAVVHEPAESSSAFNFKRIKISIRNRSDLYRNQIKLIISIVERLQAYSTRTSCLKKLLSKYKEQHEAEAYILSQIESMYESEAKYNLQRCETAWKKQHLESCHEMKQLLKDEQCTFSELLNENLQRQTELIDIRSTHLSSIENSNEKLKQLIKEQDDSPRFRAGMEGPSSPGTNFMSKAAQHESASTSSLRASSSNEFLIKEPSVRDSLAGFAPSTRESLIRQSSNKDSAIGDSLMRQPSIKDSPIGNSLMKQSSIKDSPFGDSLMRQSSIKDSPIGDSSLREPSLRESSSREAQPKDSLHRGVSFTEPSLKESTFTRPSQLSAGGSVVSESEPSPSPSYGELTQRYSSAQREKEPSSSYRDLALREAPSFKDSFFKEPSFRDAPLKISSASSITGAPRRSIPKITNSFSNLNLDVWQDLPPSTRAGIDSPRLSNARSVQVVTPENVERPKFGRKRVAWT